MRAFFLFAAIAICAGQAELPGSVVLNGATAVWKQETGGSESITLREDKVTGSLELLARYPAGHRFAPHWHSANERMVMIEGRVSIGMPGSERFLDPGGYAFLPAKEPQYMACVSKTRCSFYVYWDGKLDFNPVK